MTEGLLPADGHRLLFVSGEGDGGAPRSTLELARRLAAKHDVRVVLGDRRSASALYGLAVRASIKMGHIGDATLARLAARMGRRRSSVDGGEPIVRSPIAANRARVEVDRWTPDVVIANSLPRAEMRWLHDYVTRRGIPFAIYAREEHAVTHFSVTALRPELALANSRNLADRISAYQPCVYIPSVVDTTVARVESSLEEVLVVNPALDCKVLDVATHCPEITFLVQESWPLERSAEQDLLDAVDGLPNVRFRRRVSGPRELFATARLVLITAEAGRPRIVAEAHANGIPVVAPDFPSLREIVGKGGVLYDPASDPPTIAAAVRDACRPSVYESLRRAAWNEATADDRDPATVLEMFEDALATALDARTRW